VRLKVGQRADVLTGHIEEGYERRQDAPPQLAAPEPSPRPQPAAPPARKRDEEPEETGEDDGVEPPKAKQDDRG
jgi:hypothetical protein